MCAMLGQNLKEKTLKTNKFKKLKNILFYAKGQNFKAIFIQVTKVEKHFMQRAKLQGQKLYK